MRSIVILTVAFVAVVAGGDCDETRFWKSVVQSTISPQRLASCEEVDTLITLAQAASCQNLVSPAVCVYAQANCPAVGCGVYFYHKDSEVKQSVLTDASADVATQADRLSDKANELADKAKAKVAQLKAKAERKATSLADKAKAKASELSDKADQVAEAAKKAKVTADEAAAKAQGAVGELDTEANEKINSAGNKVDELKEKASSKLDELKGKASDLADKASSKLGDLSKKLDGVVDESQPLAEKAKSVIHKAAEVEGAAGEAGEDVEAVNDSAQDTISQAKYAVKVSKRKQASSLEDSVIHANTVDDLASEANGIVHKIQNKEKITKADVNQVKGTIKGGLPQAKDAVKGAIAGGLPQAKGAVKGAIASAKDVLKKPTENAVEVFAEIPDRTTLDALVGSSKGAQQKGFHGPMILFVMIALTAMVIVAAHKNRIRGRHNAFEEFL